MADQNRTSWTMRVVGVEMSDLGQPEFAKEWIISLSNLKSWGFRLQK
jgi:hypothetical protein